MIRNYIVGKFRFKLVGEIQEGRVKTKMWKYGQLVDEFTIPYNEDRYSFQNIAKWFAENYVMPGVRLNTTIFKTRAKVKLSASTPTSSHHRLFFGRAVSKTIFC